MTQHGIATHLDVVRCDVHGVVGPVVDIDDRQRGLVVDDEFDVLRVGSAALLIENDDGARECLEADLHVTERRLVDAGTLERDHDRVGDLDLAGDGDDRGLVEARICLRRNAIERDSALSESLVVAPDGLDGDAVTGAGDRDSCLSVGRRAAVVQAAQASERGESPRLFTRAGNLERLDVE